MTNLLVGDVFAKIIEEVVAASTNDFEESGVSQTTLQELQQEWQAKLSQRGVAQMPWDPKPVPTPAPTLNSSTNLPSAASSSLPQQYPYEGQAEAANGGPRIKTEAGAEPQYNGVSNGYPQASASTQGGLARAQQLVQQYGNQAANGAPRGGLALPGQQARPQGLQLPAQPSQVNQAAYAQQRQQAQGPVLQRPQQPGQPNIKVENDNPQAQPSAAYAQTDGANDAMDEWNAMLAKRRAAHAEQTLQADRMMRDRILQNSASLESGLMVPLAQQPNRLASRGHAHANPAAVRGTGAGPSIPQLDGDVDDADEKADMKDDDDENAINSDLDDTDDEGQNQLGDDDDENGDQILCTYDKVQRVKNKWKCTLKDGIMSISGKDYVFHKGTGEFEW